MAWFEKLVLVLAAIGAINWGLLAISPSAELVQYLSVSWLVTLVYAVIGLCGIYALVKVFK